MKYLKPTRIALAIAAFACLNITIFTGLAAAPRAYLALSRVQVFPAIMALALSTFLFWIAVTLLLGRVYCSVLCPLGIYMDVATRLKGIFTKKPTVYHYGEPRNLLRYSSLLVFMALLILGLSLPVALLDPAQLYENFTECIHAWTTENSVVIKVVGGTFCGSVATIALMIVIAAIAATRGRLYCNTICPVGALLSLPARYALMVIDINTDRCTHCRRCEHACKARCINMNDSTVDTSRCVVCFNCINACRDDAISYTFNRHRLSDAMMQRLSTGSNAMSRPAAGDASTLSQSKPSTRK
ncbi:MAG: 4Fe-4S binding protein [Muribaculaceae bacterium]|nr:4Fe-4S binding protein [Muribaculaceae bacterium]